MKKINFSLKKNNEYIINKKNINCINNDNKLSFIIDGIKYQYFNNILIKESDSDIVTFNFDKKKVQIYLKEIDKNLNVLLTKVDIKKSKNIIKIEYIIETENDTNNIITIEYTKSS